MKKIVLIDDDELIRMSWQMAANKANIQVLLFQSIDEFLNVSHEISTDVEIYVDSNLSDGIKGEVESKKIFEQGFKKIYLATGYSKDTIDKPEWIIEIIGKRPNF